MLTFYDAVLDAPAPGAHRASRWVVVLGGGDSPRLEPFARMLYGYPRPAQLCGLFGGLSPLAHTIRRAERVVPGDRIVVTTDRAHRAEVTGIVAAEEIETFEQPRDRGTGVAVLAALLTLLPRAPTATVVILPAGHHVDDEHRFAACAVRAAAEAEAHPDRAVVLGAHPPDLRDDYGWIVPERLADGWQARALRYPTDRAEADRLARAGALVNTSVVAARATTLARWIREVEPGWWAALCDGVVDRHALETAYRVLPPFDLAARVLDADPERLRVVPLDGVGWSDIGTPARLLRIQRSVARRAAIRVGEQPLGEVG